MSWVCQKCGRDLDGFDIGFYKKMVNRGATEFWCIDCTAEYFQISPAKAQELIDHFRRTGCQLFPPL